MNEEQKKQYKERYMQAKQKGVKFWPDIIYKDVIATTLIIIVLVILATFLGVAQVPKADPSDASYLPRPEWYFLFLFKFLAIYGQVPILGKVEFLATTVVPGLAIGLLFLLPVDIPVHVCRRPGCKTIWVADSNIYQDPYRCPKCGSVDPEAFSGQGFDVD